MKRARQGRHSGKPSRAAATAAKRPSGVAPHAAPPQASVRAVVQLVNTGQLQQAASRLAPLLAQYPGAFVLWNIEGVVRTSLGQIDLACAAFRRVTRLKPDFADGHNNLGMTLKELGKLAAAAASCRRALELKPDFAEAHNNLGNILKGRGQTDHAVGSYRRAIASRPDFTQAHFNLANALAEQGHHDAAAQSYQRALELDPDFAEAHLNLAAAFQEIGRIGDAEASCRRAVGLRPAFPEAHNNLGNLLREQARYDAAEASYRRALELKPDYAEAHYNRGVTLAEQGQVKAAAACYGRALDCQPDYPDALNNLGNALMEMGQPEAAASRYREALNQLPDFAKAHNNHAMALAALGQIEAAVESHRRALEIEPGFASARAQMYHRQLHLCDWSSARDIAEACRTLGLDGDAVPPLAMLSLEDHAERQMLRSRTFARKTFRNTPLPLPAAPKARPKRLRIGFFSSDIGEHAVSYLIAGLMRERTRSRFEVFIFSSGPATSSDYREKIAQQVDGFLDVRELPDGGIVELARDHRLDIAIDLNGYTQGSRTHLFARRLAPIQIAFLGYPGTLGTEFIDYMIADRTVIPARERASYTESVIYLPDTYLPTDDRREIADAPGTRSDHGLPESGLVLCSFNNSYKIGPGEYDIWMRVMRQVEHSVLWLKGANDVAEANLRREAEARGVSRDRIIFAERVALPVHVARHAHADLFLDTFRYNAHTTASEALWAGLPVVTMAGNQFAARVCASLLHAVGLDELVTDSAADYETLVLDLARDSDRLGDLRSRLAENRASFPLFSTRRYTLHFEQGLETAYQRFLDGLPPADIDVAAIGNSA